MQVFSFFLLNKPLLHKVLLKRKCGFTFPPPFFIPQYVFSKHLGPLSVPSPFPGMKDYACLRGACVSPDRWTDPSLPLICILLPVEGSDVLVWIGHGLLERSGMKDKVCSVGRWKKSRIISRVWRSRLEQSHINLETEQRWLPSPDTPPRDREQVFWPARPPTGRAEKTSLIRAIRVTPWAGS